MHHDAQSEREKQRKQTSNSRLSKTSPDDKLETLRSDPLVQEQLKLNLNNSVKIVLRERCARLFINMYLINELENAINYRIPYTKTARKIANVRQINARVRYCRYINPFAAHPRGILHYLRTITLRYLYGI